MYNIHTAMGEDDNWSSQSKKAEYKCCSNQKNSLTWEHHLDQISLVDVVGGREPLQDILRVQVVTKEHDLVVHAKKSTFWKLLPDKDIERGNIITICF